MPGLGLDCRRDGAAVGFAVLCSYLLNKGQDRLQAMEDKAKADGVVTRQERKHLQYAQNNQSQQIRSQKNDRQRRHFKGHQQQANR